MHVTVHRLYVDIFALACDLASLLPSRNHDTIALGSSRVAEVAFLGNENGESDRVGREIRGAYDGLTQTSRAVGPISVGGESGAAFGGGINIRRSCWQARVQRNAGARGFRRFHPQAAHRHQRHEERQTHSSSAGALLRHGIDRYSK